MTDPGACQFSELIILNDFRYLSVCSLLRLLCVLSLSIVKRLEFRLLILIAFYFRLINVWLAFVRRRLAFFFCLIDLTLTELFLPLRTLVVMLTKLAPFYLLSAQILLDVSGHLE